MLRNFFGRGRKRKLKEDEVRVVLPEEHFTLMKWKQDGLPCVGSLNDSLRDFAHKRIFSWQLSVTIDFQHLAENGMPTQAEQDLVDPFCEVLDAEIKAGGNALFLVRETWNKTRRMVWRVYDPEISHKYLQSLISSKNHPRPFDYKMEQDPSWEQTTWYFSQLKG
ncbi:MAG: DUF695 domain-containing protein [Bacteroidota bacterium]